MLSQSFLTMRANVVVVLSWGICAPSAVGQICVDTGAVYSTTQSAASDAPFSVTSCDLDGDGDLDLVTANDGSDTISVLLNNGTAGFGSLRRWPVGSVGTTYEPVDVVCCDLDGDQRLDLVTVNHTSDSISILYNLGVTAGIPQFSVAVHHPVGEAPWAVKCGRINADNHFDLVTANFTADNVSVLINNGFGAIDGVASYAVSVGDSPRSLAMCDIDGDSDMDVITGNMSGRSVSVLKNNPEGLAVSSTTSVVVNPFAIACCDLDGAQGPDIVTANIVDDSVTALFNNGCGTFSGRTRTGGSDGAAAIACADLDKDGALDVITGNLTSDDLTVFFNQGTGALDLPLAIASGVNPSSVIAAPLASAGPDLATASAEGVRVHRNTCTQECADDPDCDDSDLCTTDSCVDGVCHNEPITCDDDGDFCNGNEVCVTGLCESTGDPCSGEFAYCWESFDDCGWPGDFDRDGDTDHLDFYLFQACFNSPEDPACMGTDLDRDGDTDLEDFEAFRAALTGPGTH